ncbi:MAG: oligosaccharide flippase family protein [Bacteroidota bacterium]
MSSIKKLAGQTVWYGASTIFARFLNYLLTPYLTYKLSGAAYGEMTLVFSAIPFLNTIFLYGMETAYFRYVQKDEHKNQIYSTAFISLLCTTAVFTLLLILFNHQFAKIISIKEHPEYIIISAVIIAMDTISALPFAKLRQEGRPRKFAMIRVVGILLNIFAVWFFLSLCPSIAKKNPNSIILLFYNKNFGVGYILIATMLQSLFQVLVLLKESVRFNWSFNFTLWKEIIVYSWPLTIAAFAGVINETFDRILLGWWYPGTEEAVRMQVGTYGACYKLAILISLFIQAFRMGAEPFFFKQANQENAQKVYARVMKFFVITVTVMFLVVSLYIDVWKEFIRNKKMWEGLKVVPILLFANIFLGIYINLSIWYRLSHKTTPGAYITLIGAAITLIINYAFIPRYSYMACAWATFLCYGSMMVISYVWGQKVYPIPYALKKLIAYMVIITLLYFIHHFLTQMWTNIFFSLGLGTAFTLGYILFVIRIERKEFQKLPYIGKFVK